MLVSRFSRIILDVICIFFIFKKVTGQNSFSCPVSNQTVGVVLDCPITIEEWQEAATRKNCSRYADQCDEPDRLEYHCVINPFINETIEVCAYAQNIVGGHCTDYSISGNLIQWNTNTDCTKFTNPCPSLYLSTEAYKYPDCYRLIKRTTTTEVLTSTVNTMKTTPSDTSSDLPMGGKEDKTVALWILILPVTLIIIASGIIIARFIRNKREKRQKKDVEENEIEIFQQPDTPEKSEIVPSGKTIQSGFKGSKIEKFEDTVTPEVDLHDRELKEKKDLINSMNNRVEEFALEQDENSQQDLLDKKYDNPLFWESASPNMIRKEIDLLALRLKNIRQRKREKSGESETENTPLI